MSLLATSLSGTRPPRSASSFRRTELATWPVTWRGQRLIHTHAPALTALGIRGLDLADYLPEAAETLGGVRRVPYAPSGSAALGDAVGEAVAAGGAVILLERHGALTVGRDLAEAYDRMELAELSARVVLFAAGGDPCVSR